MLKKIFFTLIATLFLAYFSLTVFYTNLYANKQTICIDFQVNIVDASDRQYLSNNDIINSVKKAGLLPVGKDMSLVNTTEIEKKLMENRLIKKVECYKTVNGAVRVNIFHRTPILRIFSNKGSYYIDNQGEIMPVPENFAAYVPVASGFIEDKFAKTHLYEFAVFLQQDRFWNSQIKQIYVAQNGDVELTPAVGSHRIILGNIENYKENLDKLRLFYDKGLSKVGWNKYSVINLKFKNQVVCS